MATPRAGWDVKKKSDEAPQSAPQRSISSFFPSSAGLKTPAAAAATASASAPPHLRGKRAPTPLSEPPPAKKESWAAFVDPRLVRRPPRFYERAFHRNYFSSNWDHRPPGSGDFALDLIRRAPQTALGPFCAPSLLNIRAAASNLMSHFDPEQVALVDLALSPEILPIVSVLYYKYGTLWTRADWLAKDAYDTETLDLDLIRIGQKSGIFVLSSSASPLGEDEAEEIASLLTVEELCAVLGRKNVSKPELVRNCVCSLPVLLRKMHQQAGGAFMQLKPDLAETFLRMHQFALGAAEHAPEDFTSLLLTGALAGKLSLIEPHRPADVCTNGCHHALYKALDGHDVFSHGIPRGQDSKVFNEMHQASLRLLRGVSQQQCSCWASCAAADYNALLLLNAVHLLEKERRYEQAVHYLELASTTITRNAHLRGKAMLRLAIDMQHIDRADAALAMLESIVLDPANGFVFAENSTELIAKTRNRLGGVGASLIARIQMLSVPPRRWKVKIAPMMELKTTLIKVKRPKVDSPPAVRVEHLALGHFINVKGWPKGLHCENGILLSIFGLLFADCANAQRPMFSDRPRIKSSTSADVEQRLRAIERGMASDLLAAAWDQHTGRLIYGVNLLEERSSKDELVEITSCIPAMVLSMACRLLLDNFDAWQGGLPDLLLWNPGTKKCSFVEIKGPGDSLSDRQRAWGEKLSIVSGVDFEVCHVEYIVEKAVVV